MRQKLLLLTLLVTTMSYTQIRQNYVAKYDFTNTSLTNLSNPGHGDVVPNAPNRARFSNDRGTLANSALDCNNVKHFAFAMPSSGRRSVNEVGLSFWVNMQNEQSTATREERIVDYVSANGNGISFGIDATGSFYVSTRVYITTKRKVFSDANLATSNWNHVFIQFRKTNDHFLADLFVNGVKNITVSSDVSMISGQTYYNLFTEGRNQNSQLIINRSSNFAGYIDDIRLYHAVLGTADVQNLFNESPAQIQCSNSVNIPDANFKTALLAHGIGKIGTGISLIDTNRDGVICTNEAQAYSGTIDVANKNITDLTGIEAFTNATVLYVNNNQLTTLDLSNNTSLTTLYVNNNQLVNLDFSANTALTVLYVFNNQLASLNVANGNNSAMSLMRAKGNPNLLCIQHDSGFTPPAGWERDSNASWSNSCNSTCATFVNIPDVNFKRALLAHGISKTGSGISLIDTNRDDRICTTEAQAYSGTIDVTNKNITDLTGIASFTNATVLYVNNNQLTTLDVSNNTSLQTLYVNDNQLRNLDVSANTALTVLYAFNNQLTSLNVANGNNSAMSLMRAKGNRLSCIKHDTGFSPRTGWEKDASASWSANCASASVNNEVFNNTVKIYPNPASTILNISSEIVGIESVEIYNILGRKIMNTNTQNIDISSLTNGMYIAKIKSNDNKLAIKKFIKQ